MQFLIANFNLTLFFSVGSIKIKNDKKNHSKNIKLFFHPKQTFSKINKTKSIAKGNSRNSKINLHWSNNQRKKKFTSFFPNHSSFTVFLFFFFQFPRFNQQIFWWFFSIYCSCSHEQKKKEKRKWTRHTRIEMIEVLACDLDIISQYFFCCCFCYFAALYCHE